jgi:hypothetical protein
MSCQAFVHYITRGFQHWMDYYARLLSPRIAEQLFNEWDCAIARLVWIKFGRSEVHDQMLYQALPDWKDQFDREVKQLWLPVGFGGIGIRPMKIISPAAFLGSLASSASEILGAMQLVDATEPPERYLRDYKFSRDKLLENAKSLKDAVFVRCGDQIDPLKLKLLPTELTAFLRQFHNHPNLATKFQKRLCDIIWNDSFDSLIEEYTSIGDLASCRRLHSHKGFGAGRVWTLNPISPMLQLENSHLQMKFREQFGAMPAAWMYYVDGPLTCRGCGKVDFKKVPAHGHHCPDFRRQEHNDRHDAICREFVAAGKRNLIPVQWTPHLPNGKVTDLAFVFPQHTIQTDITIVSAEAPSKSGAGGPAQAAERAANVKINKYSELVATAGNLFIPMAFETSGTYTRQVSILLKRMRDAGVENGAPYPIGQREMRDRLAAIIARYNALVYIRACNRQRADSVEYALHQAEKRRRRRRSAAARAISG